MSEDLGRRVGDIVRLGRVVEVDGRRARVSLGPIESGFIKYSAARLGRLKVWARPIVGEQVLVFTPDGDLERALLGPSIATSADQAPPEAIDRIEFEDGGSISYDHDQQLLTVDLAAGGRMEISAPGGLAIKGDVQIDGDLVARGVSLPNHTHPETGPPVGGGA